MKSTGETQVQDHSSEYYDKRYSGKGFDYHFSIICEMVRDCYGLDLKILDVGCGTGILNRVYPNLDIMGIDISDGMLKRNPYKWMKASADDIPFRDGYFDMVFCRSVLHHLPNPQLALSEMKRVLKPGGSFVCWETNKSWIASLVRKLTHHGDRFSDYHTEFKDLPTLVRDYFSVSQVKYGGFFAYGLYGFPDIVNFPRFIDRLYPKFHALDELLSRSFLKKLGFWVMIKGVK